MLLPAYRLQLYFLRNKIQPTSVDQKRRESANQVPECSERGEWRRQKEGDSRELTQYKAEGVYNEAEKAQEPKQLPKHKDAPQQRSRQITDIRNYRDVYNCQAYGI